MLHRKLLSCAILLLEASFFSVARASDSSFHNIQHISFQFQRSVENSNKVSLISLLDNVISSFWAFQNVKNQIVAEANLDTSTCTVQSDGYYTASPAPKYGTWKSAIVKLTIPQGHVCAGYTLPFNVASYTWTDSPGVSAVRRSFSPRTTTTALTDTFTLQWSLTATSPVLDVFTFTADFAPRIIFAAPNGALKDITFGIETVAVGQKVALSIQPGPAPGQVTQSWTVPPTTAPLPVAGYPAETEECSTESDCPTPADFFEPSANFYWVSAGTSGKQTYNVQYSYSPSASGVTPVSATFTVYGPTGVEKITTSTSGPGKQPIQIIDNSYLSFGAYNRTLNKSGAYGIVFDASKIVTPSQYKGVFQWVQIVRHTNSKYFTGTTISRTCPTYQGPGIDLRYPYGNQTPTSTNDTPGVPLYSVFTEMTNADSFTSYLQWQPMAMGQLSLVDTIPVTLGYVKWQWNGDAIQSAGGVWSIVQSNSGFTISPYVPSGIYPTWTSVVTGSCS